MPFPYLAPLKSWIVDVLDDRERNPIENHFKRPWAVLTSGAKVIKASSAAKNADERAKEINDIVSKTTDGEGEYSGCIIRSNINPDFNYQLNKTIVGFDFNGKPIEVEGEENRRVSTPIVESIEIDTDGANNTLKTAKVSVKCFSLKQFEMFELFFCKPGMNVLIEFGDNTLQTKTYKDTIDSIQERPKAAKSVTEVIIEKTSYSNFISTFKDYYRADSTSLKKYLQRVESARGTYDLVAGKVTDYSFSIQSDGSYEVSIEISQGNQMSLAIPINISNKDSKVVGQNKNVKNGIEQWALQMASDLNLNKDDLNIKGLENEFFNWGKISETKKEETTSIDPYISFRFILQILMNYSIDEKGGYSKKDFYFNLPKYKVGSTDKEFIPIRIHKNLISSTPDLIYPNKTLVSFTGNKDKTDVVLDTKTIDGSINGYSMEESTPVYVEDASGKLSRINEPTKENPDVRNGNALNIFLNYKTIVQIWKKSYARIDFLAGVLSLINANSYGLFTLVYSPQYENTPATIICFKSENDAPKPKVLYRFKPTTIKSIVREFSFNFEMSNLVAGRTVFNTQRFLAEAFKKVKPEDRNNNIELPPSVTTSFDNSMFSNADGYYSINYIDLEAAKETFKDMVNKPTQSEPEKEEDETKAKNITEIIDSKSIKFKRGEKDIKLLIYNDLEFIRKQVKSPDSAQKNTLTPIDINIKIDGLSGFSCGEYFNIDGIPEVYNQIGVFQITNTKHSLDKDGWTTTIEAGFRINKK